MKNIKKYFQKLIEPKKKSITQDVSKRVDLSKLEKNLSYVFKNKNHIHLALTHTSFVNEKNGKSVDSNQRMELLGDAVLDLVIVEQLMLLFKNEDEGALSKMRAFLVNEDSLFEITLGLDLGKFLFLGKGEENSGGRRKPSILSDAYEAVIAAIYLDRGYSKTKEVILNHFKKRFNDLVQRRQVAMMDFDYKTKLQEFVQNTMKKTPEYSIVDDKGPEHSKEFKSIVKIDGKIMGTGFGKSKKIAEQNSAHEALKSLSYFKNGK